MGRGMNKRTVLYAVAFATTFVIGAVVGGAAVLYRTILPMAAMQARTNLVIAGKDAYVLYRYAAYPVARNALLNYSDEAKNVVSTDAAESDRTSFDIGLTYGRLALAAERAGIRSDGAIFMDLAKESSGRTRQSYDEALIRAAFERLARAWDAGLKPGA